MDLPLRPVSSVDVASFSPRERVQQLTVEQIGDVSQFRDEIVDEEAPETAGQDRLLQRTGERAFVDHIEAAKIALRERISERMCEQSGVIEVSKNSCQENVEIVRILPQRSKCLDGRVNRSGLSNYPRCHSKKLLK